MSLYTPERLFNLLDTENIPYQVIHHPPLRTVADAIAIRPASEGDDGEIKNLFLRNKKGQMWLFTLFHTRAFNLKQTATRIGAHRFSFCSEQRLMDYLGVKPGAVSLLCLLNDYSKAVTFYIDELMMSHEQWFPHPLDNTMTLRIARTDLLNLLVKHGHNYHIINLDDEALL